MSTTTITDRKRRELERTIADADYHTGQRQTGEDTSPAWPSIKREALSVLAAAGVEFQSVFIVTVHTMRGTLVSTAHLRDTTIEEVWEMIAVEYGPLDHATPAQHAPSYWRTAGNYPPLSIEVWSGIP